VVEAWLDREEVARRLPPEAVDFGTLDYDPDYGHYCRADGQPFTGVCFTRWSNGGLESVVHFVGGLAEGVSVAWEFDGGIKLYREMARDVVDGLEVLWGADGQVRSRAWFVRGRRQQAEPGAAADPARLSALVTLSCHGGPGS
jgi:hypothetical protein